MNERKLGPLEVGEMGLGCMDYSHGHGTPPKKEESIRLMRLAHELGCTLYDTADAYADVVELVKTRTAGANWAEVKADENGNVVTWWDSIKTLLKEEA